MSRRRSRRPRCDYDASCRLHGRSPLLRDVVSNLACWMQGGATPGANRSARGRATVSWALVGLLAPHPDLLHHGLVDLLHVRERSRMLGSRWKVHERCTHVRRSLRVDHWSHRVARSAGPPRLSQPDPLDAQSRAVEVEVELHLSFSMWTKTTSRGLSTASAPSRRGAGTSLCRTRTKRSSTWTTPTASSTSSGLTTPSSTTMAC